jgi:hypothetical protein
MTHKNTLIRTALSLAVLAVLAACSSTPVAPPPSVVRTAAPVNYESSITNYFDFMIPGPQTSRSLTIGVPQPSDCVMRGGGGNYAGWVVPVIYGTSALASSGHGHDAAHEAAQADADLPPRATSGTGRVGTRSKIPLKGQRNSPARNGGHAAVAAADPPAATTPTASLNEVSITGKSYFFWFSHETINAVTERLGPCP